MKFLKDLINFKFTCISKTGYFDYFYAIGRFQIGMSFLRCQLNPPNLFNSQGCKLYDLMEG